MTTNNDEKVYIIMCPPFKDFKLPPDDLSNSKLVDCPYCNEKMWCSTKKMKLKNKHEKDEVIFCCYYCFQRKAIEDDEIREGMSDAEIIEI